MGEITRNEKMERSVRKQNKDSPPQNMWILIRQACLAILCEQTP